MAEWGKIYSTLHGSLKWRRATKGARALWTTALAWCVDQEKTDGVVPAYMLRVLDGTKSEARTLIDVGLWEETAAGYRFHDWDDYQRTSEEIENARRAARERQRKSRELSRRDSQKNSFAEKNRVEKSREDIKKTVRDDFETWYDAYPKKVGRADALKAFTAAIKKTSLDELLVATRHYADTVKDSDYQYIKGPAAWLRAERWKDEPAPPAQKKWDPWEAVQ